MTARSDYTGRPDDDLQGWLAAQEGLVIVAWHNPVLDALGHHPTSEYATRYWLPTLGPTTTWLHRKLVNDLEQHPDGLPVHLPTLGRELGAGTGSSRNSLLVRSIARLVDFNLADVIDHRLAVRPVVPPLTRRQVDRLPPSLADRHRSETFVTVARTATSASGLRPADRQTSCRSAAGLEADW